MNIPYTIKKSSRARAIRITIYRTGDIVVTSPRLVPGFLVDRFVASKNEWITRKVSEFKANPPKPKNTSWGTGTHREFKEYKNAAHVLAVEKVKKYAAAYGVPFEKITIRNQKTRWGSCSKKGNLSFNYRIVFLPPELQNYLVVHEICHIREFNHSQAFWNLVEEAVPEYRELRKKLKGIEG